jgi:hypothetical protein
VIVRGCGGIGRVVVLASGFLIGSCGDFIFEVILTGAFMGTFPVAFIIDLGDLDHGLEGGRLAILMTGDAILETIRKSMVIAEYEDLITPLENGGMADKLNVISGDLVHCLHMKGFQLLCSFNLGVGHPKVDAELLNKIIPFVEPVLVNPMVLLFVETILKPTECHVLEISQSKGNLLLTILVMCSIGTEIEMALENEQGKLFRVIPTEGIWCIDLGVDRRSRSNWRWAQIKGIS